MNNLKTMIYRDENDFMRKLRSLKKYYPQSYKDFIFNVSKQDYFKLDNGTHTKEIFTSDEFKFIYGQVALIYTVEDKTIIIEDLEPSQFLLDGYMAKLGLYKNMLCRNQKDKFKIDLMFSIKERR